MSNEKNGNNNKLSSLFSKEKKRQNFVITNKQTNQLTNLTNRLSNSKKFTFAYYIHPYKFFF